jgi:hypothetical protein
LMVLKVEAATFKLTLTPNASLPKDAWQRFGKNLLLVFLLE